MLRLGERGIVEESLDRLVACGIERVVIATGYRAEEYEALARRRDGLVETAHNPDYAASGSLVSLWCARELLDEDFLLLESDLIYEPAALETLQRCGARDALLVSGPTGAGDEVWVEATDDGRLLAMGKRREELGPGVLGELVGISRVSREFFRGLVALAEARMGETLHVDYETDGFVTVGRELPMRCVLSPELLWSEIDDEAHLARARRIHPEILRRDEVR